MLMIILHTKCITVLRVMRNSKGVKGNKFPLFLLDRFLFFIFCLSFSKMAMKCFTCWFVTPFTSIFQRITLSLDISPDTAARLGTPHRATLRVWDDDGNTGLYLRLRVFMEGAVSTDTGATQAAP